MELKGKGTRRQFVRVLAGVGLGALLSGCSGESTVKTATATLTLPSATPEEETPTVVVRNTPTMVVTTITPEPSKAPTPTFIPTSIPEVTPTVKIESKTEKAIKKLIKPFWENAKKTREEKAKNDKEWVKRIDQELNHHRVNFLLFGYGKSVEPPNPTLIDVGSHTIISVDVDTGQIDIISVTHDVWDPGINKYRGDYGQKNSAAKIDQAFFEGKKKGGNDEGFRLMGKDIEEMTSLSVDYQIAFQDDEVFTDLIDGVFGGVDINVPESFDVLGYYYKGQRKGDGHFSAGTEHMSGERVCQFIKTVPKVLGAYAKSLEHNVRKAIALESLARTAINQMGNRDFQVKAVAFLAFDIIQQKIAHNFPWQIAIDAVKSVFGDPELTSQLNTGNNQGEVLKFRSSTYMVDPAFGDGGVQWVLAQAAVNPIIDGFVKRGVFPTRIDEQGRPAIDMEVTVDANPDGDYWHSTRSLVRRVLTNK